MAYFKLTRVYRFTEHQLLRVLNHRNIRGKKRRQWMKSLKKLNINGCVYQAVDKLSVPLWIRSDELQRTVLRDYVTTMTLDHLISSCEATDDHEAFIAEELVTLLEGYMKCLSQEKTLFRYIWDKRTISLKAGSRPSAVDEDGLHNFYRQYRQLTLLFDQVVQYRVLVFYLLHQSAYRQPLERVLKEGLLKREVFEMDILAYEKSCDEKHTVNRSWAYSLFSKMILAGQWLNREKIFKCLALYPHVESGRLDASFMRIFEYKVERQVSAMIQRPHISSPLPVTQWMTSYFKMRGDQQQKRIELCSDETTRTVYRWMYQVNPWRFFMYAALLEKLHVDISDPLLKDVSVFRYTMEKLRRNENRLNQALIDTYERHMALTYYQHMKVSDSQLYLDEILVSLEDEGVVE